MEDGRKVRGESQPPTDEVELFDCTGLDLQELRESSNPVLLAVMERLRARLVDQGPESAAFSDHASSAPVGAHGRAASGAEEP